MDIYHVRVRRDPEDRRYWLASVDGLDTLAPGARSLITLQQHAREVIVLAAGLADDADPAIEWHYQTGDAEADAALTRLREARVAMEEQRRTIIETTAQVARRLVFDEGMSVREAATLVGVSPARIGQLTNRPDAAHRRARRPRRQPA